MFEEDLTMISESTYLSQPVITGQMEVIPLPPTAAPLPPQAGRPGTRLNVFNVYIKDMFNLVTYLQLRCCKRKSCRENRAQSSLFKK